MNRQFMSLLQAQVGELERGGLATIEESDWLYDFIDDAIDDEEEWIVDPSYSETITHQMTAVISDFAWDVVTAAYAKLKKDISLAMSGDEKAQKRIKRKLLPYYKERGWGGWQL